MTPSTSSKCPNCSGAVLPGDRFCGNCGTRVSEASPTYDASATEAISPRLEQAAAAVRETSPWTSVEARLQASTLGEFEILTELGRGGMAAVYLAKDLTLSRRVAIKVMAPGLLLGPGMIERFRQEAVTVANLQHAHIVSIYSVRLQEDLHFFVMQFVPGRSLESVLRSGETLSIPVVRAWLYQIGSALGYAHRRGVIHRDVKPGNILLSADGEAIVTDFGIAKVAESPSHTQTGTVVGTPVYMSPEQCYARELTGASDQYSLGIVAYEMLVGHPPFTGSSFALMRAHTDEAPPPIRDARPDVPASVEAAIMRMLAKHPEDRFPTLGEALVALGAAPIAPDDPLHDTLQALAAATHRLEELGQALQTPHSPVPKTRERPKPSAATPRTPMPATQILVVALAPPPADLEPGSVATLRATVKDATGRSVPGAELRWSSNTPSVVTVDERTGSIHAVATGQALITATAGTVHDSVEVVVGGPRAATVAVTGPTSVLTVGDQATVSAVVTSRYGIRLDRPVTWSVDEQMIAVIDRGTSDASGAKAMVRAVAPGATGVVATCDGAMGRAIVRVVAAPVPVKPQPPQPPVARPDSSRPVEPAIAKPPASPPVPKTVVLSPVAPKPVDPAPAPRQQQQLPAPQADEKPPATPPAQPAPTRPIAEPAGSGHTSSRNRAWVWAALAAIVVTVIAYVLVRIATPSASTKAGTSIARSSDTTSKTPANPTRAGTGDSARVIDSTPTIPPPPSRDSIASTRTDSAPKPPTAASVVRRIELRPAKPSPIEPGQTISVSAIAHNGAGVVQNAKVSWTSSDPAVATVDPRGLVRGVGAGAARISARVGEVVSTVAVTIVPPKPDPTVVASLAISDLSTMTVGETTRLTATARNAAGEVVNGAPVDWSSSNPEVASVSPNGMVLARSAGAATIRASSGDRSAERSLTVRSKPVVVRADTPSAPRPTPPPPAAKSEAELRSDIEKVVATYARALESRDTALIRQVYPTAGNAFMNQWQQTFADGPIQLAGANVNVLDAPRDVAGAQVRVRASYTARFSSKRSRADGPVPLAFTAVLQRDGAAWHITSIR